MRSFCLISRTKSIVGMRNGTSPSCWRWMHITRKRRAKVDLPEAASPITSTGRASSTSEHTSRITTSKASDRSPEPSTLSLTHCSMMSKRSPDSASTTNE